MDYSQLLQKIRECAFNVRRALTEGYMESVYRNALMVELAEAGIFAESEKELRVEYHGVTVGIFRADIVVENCVILELKAVSELLPIHEVQLVSYLKVTGLDVGVLINYGAEKFKFLPKFRTIEILNNFKSRHN